MLCQSEICNLQFAIRSGLAPPHNKAISARVMARPYAAGRLTPLGLGGRHPTRRAALATAMGMVARVHHRSANFGPAPHPAFAPGLANSNILVVQVADLPNCRQAVEMDLSHLA